MYAVINKFPVDSLQLLLDCCLKHSDLKNMLEERNTRDEDVLGVAAVWHLPFDSFRLLLAYVRQYADLKSILDHRDSRGRTCMGRAISCFGMPVDSFKVLVAHFPTKEFFMSTLVENDWTAAQIWTREEVRILLQDPECCWAKCREWCAAEGFDF